MNSIAPEQEAVTSEEDGDFYASRLAGLNEDREVVSADDICNVHGVVLVRKGARIDSRVAGQILRHKLIKPLEEQVTITGQLNAGGVADSAGRLFGKYPDMSAMHEALDGDRLWRSLTLDADLPPILLQKLTVLEHEMPADYEKSIFSAWLSGLLARELGLEPERIQSAFLAGLGHDLGLLHIDPAILGKQEALSAPEWRAIQSHVVVGQIMMQNMPGVSEEVAQAILEHHERCDGTGYPTGKAERRLGLLGQVVGLADSLQAIRMKQFEGAGRNMMDTLPCLRINAYTYSYPVYRAMDNLLKRAGLQASGVNPYGDFSSLVGRLEARGRALQRIAAELEELEEELARTSTSARGQDLLRSLDHTRTMIITSGLVREELLTWLGGLKGDRDQHALGELSDIDLMLNELRWQLKHLLHAFNAFYDKSCAADEGVCVLVKQAMGRLLDNINAQG